MAAAPEGAVPLLRARLRPAAPASAEEVRKLLADLDSNQYAPPEAASRRLTELLELVETDLEKALSAAPSAEKRRRIEQILDSPREVREPKQVRALRAVEALERIGNVEARQVLEELAQGAESARLTQAAKESLARLRTRKLVREAEGEGKRTPAERLRALVADSEAA